MTSTTTVFPPGAGRAVGPRMRVTVEAGVSPDFGIFESVLPPRWSGPPPHVHGRYDEAFHILDGVVTFTLDGVIHECPTGSAVFVPRGAAHGFGNTSAEPARVLVVATPGALRLVEELLTLPGGMVSPDPGAVLGVYAAHDSRIIR
ncbi:MAG: cupin domain-containing protein [Pseudonocardia sp.]|nr:cupin domain-containing protein [Pseudonocardia sp.]